MGREEERKNEREKKRERGKKIGERKTRRGVEAVEGQGRL